MESVQANDVGRSEAHDAVLLITRIVSMILVPILTLAFLGLYFRPTDTTRYFAWAFHPPMTPMVVGAGYIAGAYYFTRMAISRHWHQLGRSLPAVSVFALLMAVTTILHWDQFNHDQLAFRVWVFLYAVTPPLVLWVWLNNRGQDPEIAEQDDPQVPSIIRLGLGIVGIGALAVAAVLLISPGSAVDVWPWALYPLSARILCGWYALAGTASLLLAGDARWSAWRISFQSTFIWGVLVGIATVRDWSDFHTGGIGTWIFVLAVTAWVVSFGGLYVWMERSAPVAISAGQTA